MYCQVNRSRAIVCKILVATAIASSLWAGTKTARAQAAAAPPADDKTKWHGNVAFGLSITQGNSKTLTLSGSAAAEKLLAHDEFRLGADGQYGIDNFNAKSNETTNAENIHGFVDYKHLFTERFYLNGRADAWHDDIADLQNREILGPAVGYYFIKSAATQFNAEVGGSYEHQRQGGQDSNFFLLRLGERGQHAFSKAWKIWEELNYYPKVDDFSTYLLIGEAGSEAALNARLAMRVVFQDRYNSQPASGRVPNDYGIISSIVWKY